MDDGATISPEQLHLTWETRIRVLANATVWKSLLLAFGIPSVLIGIFVASTSKHAEYALLIPAIVLGILMGLFVVVGGVIDLFGGFKAIFFLTSHGVRCVSGKGAKAASRATVVVGLLTGNPGAVGSGLLAESGQDAFIGWNDITKIKVKPRSRFIMVKQAWGIQPIGVYCTSENFSQVLDIFRYYAGDKLPK